jgi:serine/threonine protein kinase
MPLAAGTKLGPYEIQSAVGSGGMGEVYRARDTRLDRAVAIKVLPTHLSANPDLKARFEREAKAISGLQHPNICVLYDVGSQAETDYLVMEYLEGETLYARIARKPLSQEESLKIATEIADALERAHRSGIVHRDLKPGNVMLSKSGAADGFRLGEAPQP